MRNGIKSAAPLAFLRTSKLKLPFCTVLVLALTSAIQSATLAQPGPTISPRNSDLFETRIRPLLASRCYSCHSHTAGQSKGGLYLDSRAALLRGGSAPAVVPGDPEHSLLVQAVRYTDANLRMPPAGKLTSNEIEALSAWVRAGAPWPEIAAPATGVHKSAAPPTFWAFLPPRTPALPAVSAARKSWPASPIDTFILSGLEAKHLKPAPTADRRTLIRRATFDLTGLPPTPEEVNDFVADRRPDAYARLIDRLLASAAYGERWGRHWLDVARYADSNGVDENLVYNTAWRYRDYVIRAFNNDLPIDRFIQEQVAGDLLPGTPYEKDGNDRIIATGFLSLGPKMLAEDDPVKQEEDIIDEQIDTLGKAVMGVTLGCARCHDHKFDPFPQSDYYALAGIFKSTKTMLNFKNMAQWQERPLASQEDQDRLKQFESKITAKRDELNKLKKTEEDGILAKAKGAEPQYRAAALTVIRSGQDKRTLKPIMGDTGARLPAAAQLIEAEDFASGNVLKDTTGFGKGIGVLVNKGEYPNFTEYDVTVPEASVCQIDLRYASGDSRPIRIYINGTLVTSQAAGEVTGGFYPDSQRWKAEGAFQFKSGKNRVRLERDSYFPHIDKLLVMPVKGMAPTRTPDMAAAELKLLPELLSEAIEQLIKDGPGSAITFEIPDNNVSVYSAGVKAEVMRLDADINALEKDKPKLPRAMAVSEGNPVNMKVHLRGSYLTLGNESARGFPAVLRTNSDRYKIDPSHSGRLELAQWLTAPEHPLTARVFVNRVWRWHFGAGIVGTPDNFGRLGERPSNQKLLDWLATTFIKDGWSLKQLHRRIMLSNTYKMSSRYDAKATLIDPENRLHWRTDRRRLEAEEIRDSILFVGGRLDRTMEGTLLKFKDREYVTSTANADPVNYNSLRRSVYLPVVRSALYDVYTAFDFGDPTVMNGDRPSTTVSPQALFMMNSPIVLEQTRSMAENLLKRSDLDTSGRIQLAFEEAYGRQASAAQVGRAAAFMDAVSLQWAAKESDAAVRKIKSWQSLCKALLSAAEFMYVD